MSKPHARTTRKNNDQAGGGPGSSHQGGAHGHTSRTEVSAAPGEATNPPRSRVSGGGGERDRAHSHDPAFKSSKHSASKVD